MRRGSRHDEEKVWIMDPKVLEDSNLEHRDTPDHSSHSSLQQSFDQNQLHSTDTMPRRRPPIMDDTMMNMGRSANLQSTEEDVVWMEKHFLLAAERGDIGSVRHYIKNSLENKAFNLHCVDPLGRNALLIAIENENIEMIETLLEANIETGDAILYAINEENVEAVEIILNYLEKLDKFNAENQGVEINDQSAFTPDITPIILAAHRDNYEIIKMLLDRGASIPHPHDVRCSCKDCLQSNADDSLRLSRSRINAYRALASPSLVCLSARDPILYAFELSWELRRLSYIENEFKKEYQALSLRCQNFSVGMLDQVRGSKELEIILNHDTSDRWPAIRERAPGERMQLARLKLAVQFRQKRFVAHPNCQQLLASIWYEGLPGFRRRNVVFKILLIMGISISFPILALFYLLSPKHASTFIRKPFIKFLCHSASYFFFLFLLILASQRINYDNLFGTSSSSPSGSLSNSSNPISVGPQGVGIGTSVATLLKEDPDRKERRGPPPTPVEWAILAYVAGLIWVEVKQLWIMGLYEYCHNMWNILDFITNSLYLCSLGIRAIAYFQVEKEMANPATRHLGRVLPRKDWHAFDPTLISECIFATANIFSSLKLVHIFTVNPHLGPLQISLGRMIVDILKFFFVYCLVFFAFACGLNQLFWYYSTMRSQECDAYNQHQLGRLKLAEKTAEMFRDSCLPKYKSFANLFNSLETLFWAMFGLIDLDHFALKEPHTITEWCGKTMFGTYGIISIIVLLNMLIAMMSNSYQYISNQADTEWKFARSKLWIGYFEEGGTLPPPFNIIPSPKSFYYLIRFFCDRYCKCSKRIQQTKQRSLRKILKKVSEREEKHQVSQIRPIAYYSIERVRALQFVMRNLVKRYVAHVQREKQLSEGVSEDDVNEIKQDISAFRYELLGILRKAGMDTGHSDISQKTSSRSKKRNAVAERRLMKGYQSKVETIPEGSPFVTQPNLNREKKESTANDSPSKFASSPALSSLSTKLRKFSKKVKFSVGHNDSDQIGREEKGEEGILMKSVSMDTEIDRSSPSPKCEPQIAQRTKSNQLDSTINKLNAPPPYAPPPPIHNIEYCWRTDRTSPGQISTNSSSSDWPLQSVDEGGIELTIEPSIDDTLL